MKKKFSRVFTFVFAVVIISAVVTMVLIKREYRRLRRKAIPIAVYQDRDSQYETPRSPYGSVWRMNYYGPGAGYYQTGPVYGFYVSQGA